MNKKILYLTAVVTALTSCRQPEARRPVNVSSGSFMRTSIERSKNLLEEEEAMFEEIIENDSLNTYHSSANGYWYFYNVKDSLNSEKPEEGDVVKISYDIRNIREETIYSKEEIGVIDFKIDKEAYFPGLRTAVKMMSPGETMTFYFPSSLAYGYHGDENKIGTNEPIIATISLLEITEKENNENID